MWGRGATGRGTSRLVWRLCLGPKGRCGHLLTDSFQDAEIGSDLGVSPRRVPVARQVYLSGERADRGAVGLALQRYDLRHRRAGPVDGDFLSAFHPLDDAREV